MTVHNPHEASFIRLRLAAFFVLLLATVSLWGQAQAQYTNQPFYERAEVVRHAHVTALMELRLLAIETIAGTGVLPEEVGEQSEALIESDLPRLAGSLGALDQNLLAELEESLSELRESVEGEDLPGVVAATSRAREVASRVRDFLLPSGALAEPPVAAALMSLLLLGEPGVAEGYEEAVAEERWEYPLGWAALQRVNELFEATIAPLAANRSEEVEEALAELRELLPQATPPELLTGDPEDAEEPSHRIVGLLEGITDADLYRDRQVGQLARHAAELAAASCAAFESGGEALGLELALAAGDSYEPLEGTVGMLASESHSKVEESLESIIGGDEGEAGVRSACTELRSALEEIAGVFGG